SQPHPPARLSVGQPGELLFEFVRVGWSTDPLRVAFSGRIGRLGGAIPRCRSVLFLRARRIRDAGARDPVGRGRAAGDRERYRVTTDDPGIPMNCPLCGAALVYLRTEGAGTESETLCSMCLDTAC